MAVEIAKPDPTFVFFSGNDGSLNHLGCVPLLPKNFLVLMDHHIDQCTRQINCWKFSAAAADFKGN
jgi:hypothetical protein